VAYTAKFMLRKGPQALDYAVMPLEGLWWADDMSAFVANDRTRWQWTMMIMQPAFVANAVIAAAIEQVRKKKALPAIDRIRVAVSGKHHEIYISDIRRAEPKKWRTIIRQPMRPLV
jgi:hypothetical protein